MKSLRWLLATPVIVAAMIVAAPVTAHAATIRDRGGMFSKEAVRKAEQILDRAQSASGIPIVIETIDSMGLDRNASMERARACN